MKFLIIKEKKKKFKAVNNEKSFYLSSFKKSKKSNFLQLNSRCLYTGRKRSFIRILKSSRLNTRKKILEGLFSGYNKAS